MWSKLVGPILGIGLLMSPAAGKQKTKPSQAVPATEPTSWISTEDYPPAALRAELEGTVGVRLDIDAAGRPTKCNITESSNSPTLDQATCEILSKRATFVPGKDRRSFSRKITWKMPETSTGAPIDIAAASFPPTKFDMEITTGPNGAIENCRLLSSQPKEFDPCQQNPIGQSQGPGYVRNGKPVRAIVRQTFSSTTTFVDVP